MPNKLISHLVFPRAQRVILIVCGFAALLLGLIGIVLPVLPTTPFILLAAACFAKSSSRFYNMLLSNRFCGSVIRDWESKRCIRRPVRYMALGSIAFTFSLSIGFLVADTYLRLLLIVIAITLMTFLWRVPLCEGIEKIAPVKKIE